MIQKKWRIREHPNPATVNHLQEALNVPQVVAHMLVQRDITTFEGARAFFRPTYDDLHDPFLMKDMDGAVARLAQAIAQQEKIMIYGDYDVDGTTAVSLVYGFLKQHHSAIDYYIPDRYAEGYGVSEAGVRYAAAQGITLLITLDCGIKAVEKVALAKSLGVDVIICDHHTPGNELPDAFVLDPKREDCSYPYKELSGCGVGFKLLDALCTHQNWDKKTLYEHLDLLAISIGADIVPITGENRMFCQFGLKQLNESPSKGIKRLLALAQKPFPLRLVDVVFVIAPRINAAGRMGDAKEAVKLLLATDEDEVKNYAKAIHEANEERRAVDESITEEAIALLNAKPQHAERCTNFVYKKGWHKGVIGIVASRIIESFYRPTVVLTQPEDSAIYTASVRSIKGVNIYEVLEACSDLLTQFGGHYYAAGLSVHEDNLSAFEQRFEAEVRSRIDDETLIPEQVLERTIDFDELFEIGESLYTVPKFMRILTQFEPHGPSNMKPVFHAENVYAHDVRILKEKHLKFVLSQPDNRPKLNAIIFNRPDLYNTLTSGQPLSIVFTLEINEWQGKSSLQLMVKDIRPVVEFVDSQLET